MDLNDTPIAPPVLSETIVVKPDNQNNITRQNGNKQINFFIPDYVRYFLPSQSFFQASVKMSGRGLPIPSPSCAFHSFWNRITCRDGLTNSHILDETEQYNTLVSQIYTTQKTDQINNNRLMFEGLQPNDSYTNNLYWGLASGQNTWATNASAAGAASAGINPCIISPKEVQISTTLKTDLLNTDQFVPVNVLGGLNCQLAQEDYRRSLEFTTGTLAMGHAEGMCPGKYNTTDGVDCATINTAGSGFTDGNLYALHVGSAAGAICGYVIASVTTGAITSVDWYSTSTTATCPPTHATGPLILVSPSANPADDASVTIKAHILPYSKLRVGSIDAPYFIDIATGNPTDVLGAVTSTNTKVWGDGTLRDPYRTINPITNATAGLSANIQAPTDNNPFVSGDALHISKNDGSNPHTLGYITGFSRSDINNAVSGTNIMRIYFQPDVAVVTGLGNNIDPATLGGGKDGITSFNGYETYTTGYQLFLYESDRLNGLTPTNVVNPTYNSSVISAAATKIDFTIENLEYHVKRVEMDKRVDDNDMALSRGSGFNFDLNSTTTSLHNVVNVVGPTSQAIALPNIRRGLGILSIPLNQGDQFSVGKKSLVGDPTGNKVASSIALQSGMTNYQYSLGSLVGRQPYRPVPVEKYSFKNPLIQTGAVTELIKANDSFGFSTSCLQALGMNFALGRSLARPGQFFDIMEAGSIQLLANYENVSSGNKLFCHFIKHLRRINISKSGIMIQN